MSLIRAHDPFSGHQPDAPVPIHQRAQAALERLELTDSPPSPVAAAPTPPAPQAATPKVPAKRAPRRRRRPSAADLAAAEMDR